MMNKICVSALVVLTFALSGCRTETHFITDPAYRRTVEQDFRAKQELLAGAPENLFAVFDQPLTLEEKEALQFLYAYSPLIDLTSGSGEFLLENVRHSLKTRDEMPWGKEIPEAIFRHFVLPVRGSNETLDSSRMVFGRELRDRVRKCATMEDAALEVNHWCHEKAIYHPTNARTCSPLAMMSTAYGRCGEESVFAQAAMRSVGIPARQVYTPRWAHCDDNHAWIEVWVDGTWKYLGACEPEPRLDMAWFTAPVRRGLLMQARVFGKYHSDEEVASENANGTVVNVTGNYTDVKPLTVTVTDVEGRAVEGARVEFRIYNYGEYNPVASFRSGKDGRVRLTGGLGDWVVWAADGNRYGFGELKAVETDSIRIVLDKTGKSVYDQVFELVPPAEKDYQSVVSDSERAENDRRFMYEDSVRGAYIASFMGEPEISRLAEETGTDENLLKRCIRDSRGNYGEIVRFVKEIPSVQLPLAMELLGLLPDKDLQDVSAAVLRDHLEGSLIYRDSARYPEYQLQGNIAYPELFRDYILNPRVKNELLTAWRKPLKDYLLRKNISSAGQLLAAMDEIRAVDSVNTMNVATPPAGVLSAMVTDSRSKELFFVAACRTMGVAARLNPVDGKPEYNEGKGWIPAVAGGQVVPRGQLMLSYKGQEVKDPVYYTHFTISRLVGGAPRSIDLGSNAQVDMGGGASFNAIFRNPVELEEGDYILTTGNRRGDGSVHSGISSFSVKAGKRTEVEMKIPEINEVFQVLGHIEPEMKFVPEGKEASETFRAPESGYTVVAIMQANKEPVNHMIRDMSELKEDFEQKGVPMMFLFTDKEQLGKFSRHDFRPLPSVMKIGHDQQGQILKMLTERLNLNNPDNLPLVVMFNRKGEVVFISQGYRIGLGRQILRVMSY